MTLVSKIHLEEVLLIERVEEGEVSFESGLFMNDIPIIFGQFLRSYTHAQHVLHLFL